MAIDPFLGTRAQQGFMGTILVQAIVVLALVGQVFNWIDKWVDFNTSMYKTVPCYLALFALAEIFELAMGLDALRARNIIQVIGILIFHGALIIFAAIQVHETSQALGADGNCDYDGTRDSYVGCTGSGTLWQKVRPLLIVAPCIIGVAWTSMIWWAWNLYTEFGWAIFRVVGANPAMKTMYQYYQVIICLLKFDFFCFTGVTIQLLIVVLSTNSAEFGVTIAAIPVVLVLLAGAGYAVQREIKWMMSIALVLMLAAETYFIYKLVRFYEPDSRAQYQTTRVTLTVFTIVAFIILFATFVVGIRCFADFDKGLLASKVHDVNATQKYSSGLPTSGPATEQKDTYQGGTELSPRISIE
jgi:hypothetical protein